MGRRIRYVPAGGSVVEVTCRTVQGRLLLRPSPQLTAITLGILARAGRRYGVAVIAHSFLSNHYHLLLFVTSAAQLAAFMAYLNSNLAREAGRLYGWREKFWGRRYQAVLVSSEPEAQIDRLVYLLSQGVKEGLVASPFDWPGAHCARALVEGTPLQGLWRNRTLEWRSRKNALGQDAEASLEREELVLTPLPCWQHLAPEAQRAEVRKLITEIEATARERFEATGQPPLGSDRIARQHPHSAPNRLKKSPAPLVHAIDPDVRRALRQAYFRFADAFRRAAMKLRAGVLDVEFPAGAFPPPRPVSLAIGSG